MSLITLGKFIDKWNGEYLDYDKSFGYQCVDLVRSYVEEVHNLKPYAAIPSTGSAKNIFKNFKDNQVFKKVYNTPTGIPAIGDIIFWDWRWPVTGWDGHVAIVTGANVNNFIVFGQNYGQPNFCRYQNYKDYRGVLGWLVRK